MSSTFKSNYEHLNIHEIYNTIEVLWADLFHRTHQKVERDNIDHEN